MCYRDHLSWIRRYSSYWIGTLDVLWSLCLQRSSALMCELSLVTTLWSLPSLLSNLSDSALCASELVNWEWEREKEGESVCVVWRHGWREKDQNLLNFQGIVYFPIQGCIWWIHSSCWLVALLSAVLLWFVFYPYRHWWRRNGRISTSKNFNIIITKHVYMYNISA